MYKVLCKIKYMLLFKFNLKLVFLFQYSYYLFINNYLVIKYSF